MNDLFNINAVKALDLSAIKNAALVKESESLAALQSKIMSGAAKFAGNVETIRREQAVILYRIQATKLYEKDNFKSLAEYAETIGLSKANAHALAAAGKVYADKNAPEQLLNLTPSKLAVIASTIKNNKEQVYKDAESGALDDMTQSQLKDYANANKGTPKAKIVKTYLPYVRGRNGLVEYMDEDENGEKPHMPNTPDGWVEHFASSFGEAQYIKPDKDGNKRIIAMWDDGEVAALVTLIEYKPNQNGKTKTTTGKAEFLARAAAEGMTDEQIKTVLKVMGW